MTGLATYLWPEREYSGYPPNDLAQTLFSVFAQSLIRKDSHSTWYHLPMCQFRVLAGADSAAGAAGRTSSDVSCGCHCCLWTQLSEYHVEGGPDLLANGETRAVQADSCDLGAVNI